MTFRIDDHYQIEREWGGAWRGVALLPENMVYDIRWSVADDYGAGHLTIDIYDDLTITRAAGTLVIAE